MALYHLFTNNLVYGMRSHKSQGRGYLDNVIVWKYDGTKEHNLYVYDFINNNLKIKQYDNTLKDYLLKLRKANWHYMDHDDVVMTLDNLDVYLKRRRSNKIKNIKKKLYNFFKSIAKALFITTIISGVIYYFFS